jgi:hypothetical protein
MQDVFGSGAIKSATDFQIYQEVAGLPGLDFAYTYTTSVYHTKFVLLVIYFFLLVIIVICDISMNSSWLSIP